MPPVSSGATKRSKAGSFAGAQRNVVLRGSGHRLVEVDVQRDALGIPAGSNPRAEA